MDTLRALILGAVQGATEFLPVSSSGHLKLGQTLLELDQAQLLFDIVLHVGTLLSVMLFYRDDVLLALKGIVQGARDGARARSWRALLAPEGMRLSVLIVLSTIPTAILGLLLSDVLEPDTGLSPITPRVVCMLLLVNGAILMSNAYFLKRERGADAGGEDATEAGSALSLWHITPLIALTLGVAQGAAILPGISRSGMTITVALALSVQRMHAARYSFLLSIPAILGALALKLGDVGEAGSLSAHPWGAYIAGAICAAVIGYACLMLLTRMLKNAHFHHFAWYCWAVGLLGLWLL